MSLFMRILFVVFTLIFSSMPGVSSQNGILRLGKNRNRRYAEPINKTSGEFLEAVFLKYGGSKSSLTIQDFDEFITNQGIGKNISKTSEWKNHSLQGQCFSSEQLLDLHGFDHSSSLNHDKFKKLCPALIQQIDSGSCTDDEEEITEPPKKKESLAKAWGFSILTVTVISLASMCGAFVVPFMEKSFFQFILLLMVSLAVGVLGGSGIFHLLPNSLGLGLDGNYSYLGKCSMIVGGIYLFFVTEYLMKMYVRYKDHKHGVPTIGHSHGHSHTHGRSHDNSGRHAHTNGEVVDLKPSTGMKPGISQVPLFNDINDIDTTSGCPSPSSIVDEDAAFFNNGDRVSVCLSCGGKLAKTSSRDDEESSNVIDVDEILPSHYNLEHVERRPTFNEGMRWAESVEPEETANDKSVVPAEIKQEVMSVLPHVHHAEEVTIHEVPKKIKKRIATMAWMIIFGDGLHNFIDGLAIGSAYSSSVYEGISISLAIFCEELPHELGDFAILLNSGMTFKKAIGFNFLSACTCYLGMVIGLLLGYDTSSVKWIYALAGGMFIYISLVDMLPEATEMSIILGGDRSLRKQFKTFLIQNIGMSFGFIIMLVLGIYGPSITI